jgi:hypothetical protein
MTDQWRRVPTNAETKAVFPSARTWQKELEDGHLTVITSFEQHAFGGPWLMHFSISHRTNDHPPQPGRYPSWDEQKEAVWRFCPGKRMASYLPKEGDPYINIHPTTFHWWEVPDEPDERIIVRTES